MQHGLLIALVCVALSVGYGMLAPTFQGMVRRVSGDLVGQRGHVEGDGRRAKRAERPGEPSGGTGHGPGLRGGLGSAAVLAEPGASAVE